ncbi:hypothetical protein P261_00975 [Lachnospiraceae bacterium TWA4]|nr:hypothetical protein P261_00975 [Lachnospiraceae bacterium TWA4]
MELYLVHIILRNIYKKSSWFGQSISIWGGYLIVLILAIILAKLLAIIESKIKL